MRNSVYHNFLFLLLTLMTQTGHSTTGKSCEELKKVILFIADSHFISNDSDYLKSIPQVTNDDIANTITDKILLAIELWIEALNESPESKITVDEAKVARNIIQNAILTGEPNCQLLFELNKLKLHALKRYLKATKIVNANLKEWEVDESLPHSRFPYKSPKAAADIKELQNIVFNHINTLLASERDLPKREEKFKSHIKDLENEIKDLELQSEDENNAEFLKYYSFAFDPHTEDLTQQDKLEFEQSINNSLGVIGISIEREDTKFKVKKVLPGGYAHKTLNDPVVDESKKIKPNDKITAISQDGINFVDTSTLKTQKVISLLNGTENTSVFLKIQRENLSSDLIVEAKRHKESYVSGDTFYSDIHSVKIDEKTTLKIGVIHFFHFYKNIRQEVINALEKLVSEGAEGIVIDLRGNTGGLVTEVSSLVDDFISKGVVSEYLNAKARPLPNNNLPQNPSITYKGPIVVAIDKGSASASEIFAGAIQDYKRGIIVGPSNSYGKGTAQGIIEGIPETTAKYVLRFPPNGFSGAIKLTTGAFYLPSGRSTQFSGVSPDIKFPSPDSTVFYGPLGESSYRQSLKLKSIDRTVNIQEALGSDKNTWIPVEKEVLDKLAERSKTRMSTDNLALKIEEFNQKTKALSEKGSASVKEYVDLKDWFKNEFKANSSLPDETPSSKYDVHKRLSDREILAIAADYVNLLKAKK